MMQTSLPLVSLISVNYNQLDHTMEFLRSVEQLTYPNLEVFIVDNASRTDPGETIKKLFPKTKYIRSEKNLGFAGGNNLAVKVCKGDYIFFLNNDTILYPDFLEGIVEFMENHPDAGMASPKVVFADEKTIQYAGTSKINFLGRGRRIGLWEQDKGQYDTIYQTELGHGAALIVPRKIITEIGMMPEIYFLYYEEHDWCEHVKRKGYKMYYLGISKVIHKESVSTGGDESYIKVYHLNRNRLLFMRRNWKGVTLLAGVIYFLLISAPKNTLRYLIKGKFNLAKAILQGIAWNFKHSAT